MTKIGEPLTDDVYGSGYDEYLRRGFEGSTSSDELESEIGYSYQELFDLAKGGGPSSFSTTIIFSATDEDTVAWTSGSIAYQDGSKYTIAGSNTGNIAAQSYIYFNPNVSDTTLQVTTTYSAAVSDGAIVLAICKNNTDTNGKAQIQTIGSLGVYPPAVSTTHLEEGVMTVPLVMTPTSDTTALVDINKSDGSAIMRIDSTNLRLGFGTDSPEKFVEFNHNSNTELLRLRGLDEAITETHFPDTQVDPSSAWVNEANIEASDDARTTTNTFSDVDLNLSSFGFVSVGGTIVGISVSVEARNSSGGNRQIKVKLSGDAGSTFSEIKSTGNIAAGDTVYTLGGAADLWTYTWNPTKFSNANFLLVLTADYVSGTASCAIDYLTVTVYYTQGTGVSSTQIADIFVGVGGSMVFDLTPGGSTSQYFDFRSEDDQYGLVIRESDGTGTTALANFYVVDGTPDYLSINVTGATTTTALNITSNNTVGVGTASPGAKFHVLGDNDDAIRIEGAATNELADIFVAVDGNLVISTVPGSDTAPYIDIRPKDNEYGLVLRESDGTGTAVFANFYVVDAATDYMTINLNAATATTGIVIDANHQLGVGVTPTSKLHVNGNVKIGTGAAGVDYTLTFDGETNDGVLTFLEDEDTFSFDSKVLAASDLEVQGDQYFVNSGAGLPFGNMYLRQADSDIVVSVAASATWYEVASGVIGGLTNLTTFQNSHEILVSKAGKYLITWGMSLTTGAANDEVMGTVGVNGTASEEAAGNGTIKNAGSFIGASGTTILTLAANDLVSMFVQNETAIRDITIQHITMTIVQVGA